MKELSIAGKATRYDLAIEVAKKYHNGTLKDVMETIFPELKESEEEKVRKKLINIVKKSYEQGGYALHKWESDEMLAWLEKQGKQDSLNTKQECIKGILRVQEYQDLSDWEKKFDNIASLYAHNKNQEGYNESWYVKDRASEMLYHAKKELEKQGEPTDKVSLDFNKGDILYEQKTMSILLVYERNGSWLMTFCDYWMLKEKLHVEFPYENYGFVQEMSLVPATKEQRDLLLQKIKEAGYEWDAEKKELKIEQKPIKEHNICDTCDEKASCVNPCPVKLIEEQKPAWSEEDEKTWKELIEEVKDQLDSVPSPDCMGKEDEKVLKQLTRWLDWLKSLKDRVQPQPKQEWSKEEQQTIKDAASFILSCVNIVETKEEEKRLEELADKLQDLRPQKQWKPSKEQMDALANALSLAKNCGEESAFDLRTLYEQLKKLREE